MCLFPPHRRLRWIAHYVKHGRLQEAFDLGWDGVVPSQPARRPLGARATNGDAKAAAEAALLGVKGEGWGIRLGEREPPHQAQPMIYHV